MKLTSTKDQKPTLSTKKKSNHQSIGINIFINTIIVIGVILGAIAPFLHIIPSKESTIKVFGFNNMRAFLFAFGFPFTLFVLSIFIAFLANLLELRPYKRVIKLASITFTSVAMYFIVWTFWYRNDFDVYLYYSAICVVSILSSLGIFMLLKSVTKKLVTLNSLSEKIPKLHSDIEYVNGIADLMPDDDKMVTYKAMLDSTGDDLRDKYEDIEKDLKSIENVKETENKKQRIK